MTLILLSARHLKSVIFQGVKNLESGRILKLINLRHYSLMNILANLLGPSQTRDPLMDVAYFVVVPLLYLATCSGFIFLHYFVLLVSEAAILVCAIHFEVLSLYAP